MAESSNVLKPQPGPQTQFCASSADIAVYGGQAGGGKTFGLILDPLRYVNVPGFGAVTFRRTVPEIKRMGALWDTSVPVYQSIGGVPSSSNFTWKFGNTSQFQFSGMEHEDDCYSWQGSQIAWIGYDELTHFTAKQFWYMLSRNRTECGVPPCIRGTCNPDPDSFVAELIDWWIDDEGFPIIERSGVIRWFVREGNDIVWDKKEKLHPHKRKSFTFIPATVYDNKILLEKNPQYLANLEALSFVERARLLGGNWKIRQAPGTVFKREWFEVVDDPPVRKAVIRYWDLAGTEVKRNKKGKAINNPDWTSGCKMSLGEDGCYYIEDVIRFRQGPFRVKSSVKKIATQDGNHVKIGLEQDPGQAGKAQVFELVRYLSGYNARRYAPKESKTLRADSASAQSEIGNIKLVRGSWNSAFLNELENFPSDKFKDDQVDSFTGAFNALSKETNYSGPRARGV